VTKRSHQSISPLLLVGIIAIFLAVIYLSYRPDLPAIMGISTTKSAAQTKVTVKLKTGYQNPMSQKTQYVNPFSQRKNPFDNLK